MTKQRNRYENALVFIFFIAFGFIFLDRNALALLLPVMVNDMSLTNSQIGQVNMLQTIGYAISAPLFAIWSDRLGSRKQIIIWAILATSILSGLTTLTSSYTFLLVVRTLLGVAEGAILPLMITLVTAASRPGRFARNVGFVYLGAAIIGTTIGPIVVTQLAAAINWRTTFLFVSIPTFIMTFIIWKFVKESSSDATAEQHEEHAASWSNIGKLFTYRNIVVCVIIAIFHMAFMWTMLSFGPIYFTTLGKLSPEKMGFTMAGFGLIANLYTILIPLTSNFSGRKKALISYLILAMLVPLALYLYPEGWVSILAFSILGGIIPSLTSMYVSIIPVESVPARFHSTAGAIILGIGELIGAFAIGLSGSLADIYGLPVTMIVALAACIACIIMGFFLMETHKAKAKVAQTTLVEG